jgi:superfamily II DNA or RNA helicase
MEKSIKQPSELKSIIFSYPELFRLSNQADAFAEFFHESLAAGRKPLPEEFSSTVVNPLVQLNDIPTCFASSPQEESLSWHQSPGDQQLEDSIQYFFSDGTCISAREILFSPNSAAVPLRLLPLMSRIRPEVGNHSWVKLFAEHDFPEWGDLRKAELSLISILINATADSSIDVWMTRSLNREETRLAGRITRTGVLQKQKSHWQLGGDPITDYLSSEGQTYLKFVEVPHTSDGRLFYNFELSQAESALLFHPYAKSIETVCQALYSKLGQGKTYEEWRDEVSDSYRKLAFPLHGNQFILETTRRVDQKLQEIGALPIQRQSILGLNSSQIESQIWINRNGHIQFCRRVTLSPTSETETASKLLTLWNLPPVAQRFLLGLNGGLGALQESEVKNIAQDRKGLKRDRDLKILKHTGVFALILLQSASYVLEGKTFEGTPVPSLDDFLRILFNKLGNLLHEVERRAGFIELSPALSLDKLCSKNVIDLLRDFVVFLTELDQKATEHLFASNREYEIRGGSKSVLALFYAILTQVALESRGQCFLKPRLNAFAEFLGPNENSPLSELFLVYSKFLADSTVENDAPQVQKYSVSSNWLPADQLLKSLLPLRKSGFTLFYNNLPLDEMEIGDFNPVFDLIEPVDIPTEKSQTIDWFELNPKFFFKGVEVESSSLSQLAKEGILEFQGKIYLIQNKNLPSIKRLETFWAKIQTAQIVTSKRKTSDRYYKLPKSQTLDMLALRATGIQIKGGPHWQKICEFYDSLDKKRSPLQLPDTLSAELKPYQVTGVQWLLDLYQLGLGGILADDMGLGKTIQTLSFLEVLRTKKEMGSTLILVPTSLTYNWMSEATRFTSQLPILIFQSKMKDQVTEFLGKNKNGAVICTYGLFTEHQDFFSTQKWNILIFDEAQNLKNITSKRTTASRQVSARFKVCLTGTPLENHLGEFYSLLDLVVSGSLGDLGSFREKFIAPETIDKGELKFLKLKARPLVLRRTKAEILTELPPKMESTVKLPFEQKQEKIYRDIALSWNDKVKSSILADGEAKSQLLMLTALLRLRQACSDPSSIPNVKYDEEPPKVSVLLEALQEITESGESALVFTQFIHTFERIKKELKGNNIEHYSLHGGTSRPERERILRQFQESSKGAVLLMTLKTGGVGLNLIKASYVFHLEPWWNPAVENQATDRAHRIGQQRPVQVYRYLMRESVEEKIEILKERKSARFNALFSPAENDSDINTGGSLLTQEDFEYLLT